MCSILRTSLSQTPKLKNKHRLLWKIQFANLLELNEKKFGLFVKEIESESLFERLTYASNPNERIIKFSRFPNTRVAENYFQINEWVASAHGSIELEEFLEKNNRVIEAIKKLGVENFKNYFLYSKEPLMPEEIGSLNGIDSQLVREINNFVDDISIKGEFFYPSILRTANALKYNKVASIELASNNEFVINLFSIFLARGKYIIDYEKFESLKEKGLFNKEELAAGKDLIKKLEKINARKSTLYQILWQIANKQIRYFRTSDIKELVPFSQTELAKNVNVDCSVVNRLIFAKSVVANGTERPLVFFLPSQKKVAKYIIGELILSKQISDNGIRKHLLINHGINASQRSICKYRNELN